MLIDPWGSFLLEDYEKLIDEFGLEAFHPEALPGPNRLMRRLVVFAGQDLGLIAKCIKEKKPYYALSGIMPTSDRIHLGNRMVVENLQYFQKHGAKTYILIADLEAAAVRGVSVAEARKRALDFHIPAYLALGLDPKKTLFYFQSENTAVVKIAYEAARKLTINEFRGAYGSDEPGKIMGAVTQIGDMLFPQLEQRMPGVIPVGIDQANHLRLCRDYVRKVRLQKYFLPSSIYHKFTPALDGAFKMSKSNPESMIELPEDIGSVRKKIMKAVSGGRKTVGEHRELGAHVEKDMVFELLKQHLIEDDRELQRIYHDYKSGKLLSSEIKQIAVERMERFMKDFERKLLQARKLVPKLRFIRFSEG